MFKFRSIRTKVSLCAGVCLMVMAVIIIGYSASSVHQSELKNAERQLGALAHENGELANNTIDAALSAARTVAQALNVIRAGDKKVALGRAEVNALLRSILEKNPEFLGIYTCWEPNAFDGKDAAFAGKEGHDASGRFIPYWCRGAKGEIHVEPLADYENQERDAMGVRKGEYYLRPKETKDESIIDPYFYAVQGKNVLMTSLLVPILDGDKFVGIAGVDIGLDFLQKQMDTVHLYEGAAQMALISNNGTLAGVTGRPELMGKQMKEIHGSDYKEDLALIQAGKEEIGPDGKNIQAFIPLQFGKTKTPWSVSFMVPQVKLLASARTMMWKQIWIGLACVVAALVALWIVAGGIARPIRQAAESLQDIAEGEGDLTRRIDVRTSDEVGELGIWFNHFVEKVQVMVRDVAANARDVGSAAIQIAASSEQMACGIQQQNQQTEQVSAAIEEMSATVIEVARKAADAAHQAAEGGKQASQGEQIVKQTIDGINNIAAVVNQTAASIDALGTHSNEIGQITGVIDDIADQTNLLALNAAIEAARAGEHGRGFAVVADEVRKLAERTSRATKQIAESIKTIQSETQSAVQRMNEGTGRVADGVKLAERAGAALQAIVETEKQAIVMIESIAAASQQQASAAEQISHNVESISQVTRQTGEGANQAAQAAAHLSLKSEQLQELIGQFKIGQA